MKTLIAAGALALLLGIAASQTRLSLAIGSAGLQLHAVVGHSLELAVKLGDLAGTLS